ncbi:MULTISPECIES: PhnD/SsuA/transferrin family substrate-binding protein [Bacillaceae]|uniref:PhnD/SsuA/transferrin family substrate-binding protein n=1 Tax=Evansella alkalicola TaxID=745819 RepID=A0ABS6JY03_9BACI|nr:MULTISPECIES: PhnD/SsuA/transferrin family substrate-binding protein [Bacillaceae]MBU9723463.1 PhnD/SsuA/transferrin family substrate-binding protein [Bacillus alkalicola]
MLSIFKSIVFVFISILLLAACGEAETETQAETPTSPETAGESSQSDGVDRSEWPEKIRFAVTGIEGMEELQRRYDVFQELIEDLMGVEFEFFALSDRTISTTALEYDQVDIILSGPSEYVLTKSAVPTAEPLAAVERDAYHTVFIVAEDSEFKTLEDLKGHKIAMKDTGSTSGHIGPSSILIDAGFDLDRDVNILLLGGASVEALKSGEVDAVGDGIRVFNKMVEEDGEGVWRLLHEGPPLPQDPFVANPNLPESFKAEFKRVLLENQEEILNAILNHEDNNKYINAKIVEISDADYDLMRETYSTLGIELE